MSTVLHTSVATLYSNLVTRPTGRAVRVAIERQIQDIQGPCLSILDFSEVDIIDYSCADEVIAKLLLAHRRPEGPTDDVYFIAKGLDGASRDPIESVLRHHGLLLVTVDGQIAALWGPAPARLREAWDSLEALGRAEADEFADHRGLKRSTATAWLRRLAELRVVVAESDHRYVSLSRFVNLGT